MAQTIRAPYKSNEAEALMLVKKMELTMYPQLDADVENEEKMWEVVALRNGIPKDIHEQLASKIEQANILIEQGGGISNVMGGSSLKGIVLSTDFRTLNKPSAMLIYSLLGFAPEQYVKVGDCGVEGCCRLRCPICQPKLTLVVCIETRFDNAVIALAQVNARTPAETPVTCFSNNDITAGDIILNGVGGMAILNLVHRTFRPVDSFFQPPNKQI